MNMHVAILKCAYYRHTTSANPLLQLNAEETRQLVTYHHQHLPRSCVSLLVPTAVNPILSHMGKKHISS